MTLTVEMDSDLLYHVNFNGVQDPRGFWDALEAMKWALDNFGARW